VNHSPSFHTDSKLDLEIKEGLLNDTLAMLNMKNLDRHKVENADRKRIQERLLSKINPYVKRFDISNQTTSLLRIRTRYLILYYNTVERKKMRMLQRLFQQLTNSLPTKWKTQADID